MDILSYLKTEKNKVDRMLGISVTRGVGLPSEELYGAMAYSLAAGGKRLRPILTVSSFRACGGGEDNDPLYRAACSLELIHTYTLIHDDLPVMDDDDFRRGVPTCHRRFGVRRAVLSGAGLLVLAFGELNGALMDLGLPGHSRGRALAEVARSVGGGGVIGGQVVDLESEGRVTDRETLDYIHTHKTGALIRVSCTLGGILAGAEDTRLAALAEYGESIGLAFQIVDDLLDIEGDFKALGKTVGADQAHGKCTFPSLYGMEESRRMASHAVKQAQDILAVSGLDSSGILGALARFILERRN